MDEREKFIEDINRVVFADRPKEKAEIRDRQPLIAKELRDAGSVRMNGVGQRIARIDYRVYWRWNQELPGCWQDKGFVDAFLRDNPCYRAKTESKA